MKITNNHNLPQTLVNAIERDDYSMGAARMSITGLLRPPQITHLTKKHHNQITSDVTDNIWSLFGRAVHHILERGGDENHVTEERLFAEVRGWPVSGQIDLQKLGGDRIKITDYKVCKAYSVLNERPEWEQQLNLYRWLAQKTKGYNVTELSVCAFVRDWNRHRAKSDKGYPQADAVMIPIKMWTMDEAQSFIEDRVRIHQATIAATSMGDEPPPCSDEDRWMRGAMWAVKKPENKTAYRRFDNEADAMALKDKLGEEYVVVKQEATPTRCEGNYCHVAPWCKQHGAWVEEKLK